MRRFSSGLLSSACVVLGLVGGCDTGLAGEDAEAPDARRLDAGSSEDAGDVPAIDVGSAIDAGRIDAGSAQDAAPIDAAATDDAPRCTPGETLGLFVWADDLATRRDAILDLAEGAGVTEIYLHANLFYAGDLGADVLADWIRAAERRCIGVELLFGNARWILPAGQHEVTDRVAWAASFADAHGDARPRGLHFDLEPQQLAEWDVMADRPMLLGALVDVLEAATPTAETAGLPLSVDVGFFLDGYDVTRGGRTRPASEWVTDAVSRLVVMDYRDSAESMGHGGIISLAQTEVDYATSQGTPVVLAVETTAVAPEYVTFLEEGRAALFAELALARAHFAGTGVEGFAIHDERGLAALGP